MPGENGIGAVVAVVGLGAPPDRFHQRLHDAPLRLLRRLLVLAVEVDGRAAGKLLLARRVRLFEPRIHDNIHLCAVISTKQILTTKNTNNKKLDSILS